MVFPSLPTDSLYKFAFVGGILLLLFSIFSVNESVKLKSKIVVQLDTLVEAQKVLAAQDAKIMESATSAVAVRLLTDSLLKLYKSGGMSKEKIDSLIKVDLGWRKHFDELYKKKEKLVDNNKIKMIDIKTLLASYKHLEKETYFYFFTAFVGMIMWIYGFRNWFKQQVILDIILERQRDLIELEYQSKLKATDKTKYRKP